MKRTYYLLVFFYVNIGLIYGQTFPPTYTNAPCLNCTPPFGYSIVSGTSAISNSFSYGGNSSAFNDWVTAVPAPPSKTAAVFPNTNGLFLTLKVTANQGDKVKVTSGGFVVGFEYTLTYYVLSSHVFNSQFGNSATLQISNNDPFAPAIVATRVTSFNGNYNQWLPEELTFIASATDLNFTFSGTSPNGGTGYVNFDIHSQPFSCRITGGPVKLIRTSDVTPFPCGSINLYEQAKLPLPTGTSVVWKNNPNSNYPSMTVQEASEAGPLIPGSNYYAFYKGENTPYECYNTKVSTAAFSFTAAETQVSLNKHIATINCTDQTTFDLTSQVSPSPYKVRWFDNDKHLGAVIANPQQVSLGNYYAFYYNPGTGCYSTDKATASATFSVTPSTICCYDPSAPSSQVPLSGNTANIVCPMQTADLTIFLPQPFNLPPNTVLEWFTSPDHTTGKIDDPSHVTSGTYYAFAHDIVYGCYNTNISTSFVNVNTPCAAAELTVTLEMDGLSFNEGTERDFIVNIFEINGFNTTGNVSFRINKIGAFDITYSTGSGVSNVFGTVNNANGDWSFSEDANFITANSNLTLPANGHSIIGFKIKRKTDKPAGVIQNLTTTIVNNSGGEKNTYNNTTVTAVSTN